MHKGMFAVTLIVIAAIIAGAYLLAGRLEGIAGIVATSCLIACAIACVTVLYTRLSGSSAGKKRDLGLVQKIRDASADAISALIAYVDTSSSCIHDHLRSGCVFASRHNGNGREAHMLPGRKIESQDWRELATKIRLACEAGAGSEDLVTSAEEFTRAMNEITADISKQFAQENTGENRNAMHELVLENTYCLEMTRGMIESIREHINKSSKPLSEEIFLIKQIVYFFQQNILEWRNELSGGGSGNRNFDTVIVKYNKQNEEYGRIAERIERNFSIIENNFTSIIEMIGRILVNSAQIEDISAKINLLSINAAIESTKAGIFGKGFKVISSEIVKLSGDTKSFAENIRNVIEETKNFTATAITGFHTNENELVGKLAGQREEFGEFYKLLKNYNEDFNRIFSLVESVSEDINTHIRKVNPVFQLHDITVQQIENLRKIINLVHDGADADALFNHVFSTLDQEKKDEILGGLLDLAEKVVTTDNELDIIRHIAEKYKLSYKVAATNTKSGEIELF